jgi:hypothetical protein
MNKASLTEPQPRVSRPLVDAYEAGRYIGGASHWTMRRLARSRQIASIKLGGRLLFDLDDLDDYIDRNRRPRLIKKGKAVTPRVPVPAEAAL